ncbi:hypothetical protein OAW20_02150 [Gammaproteobacteria bacterium]|nr:hypothetical protein [Gammaproteobacteria bacterium]
MKRQKTIGEVVVNAFKNAEKFLKKVEWLELHMGRYEVNRQRRIDRKFSQFLAFPKLKRAVTYQEARGEVKQLANNVSELNPEYNIEQRKLQAKRIKDNRWQTHEDWFQDYAELFLSDPHIDKED